MRFRFVFILLTLFSLVMVADHEDLAELTASDELPVPSVRTKTYKGKYHFIEEETGDTLCMIVFNPLTVYPEERFKSKEDEQFYWRTVRDVRRTLPYAKLICETLLETYEYIETFPTKKEKEDYLKEMESEIFKQYKPVMKKFTRSQGKMLLKLVYRETDQSSYNIVKAFLGSFRAGAWYVFGRFFGVNIKVKYRPETDEKDAVIERICTRFELGRL